MHPLDRVECVLGDITAQDLDAVVNAANEGMRGGGGVDGAIHRADRDGTGGEAALLTTCHRNALALAAEHGVRTVAFPAISTGVFGYPWAKAAQVSIAALDGGLAEHSSIQLARLVLFNQELLEVYDAELTRQRG